MFSFSRIGLVGLLAIAMGVSPALADVIYTDGTFNLANYQASPTFVQNATVTLTDTQCASCGHPNNALQFTSTFSSSSATLQVAALGLANTGFTYNPLTQGAIASIDASVDKNFIINIAGTGFGNTFRPLIKQDGVYYLAAIPGPSQTFGTGGGSSGYLTISQTGLLATNFLSFDFTTGTFGSANPNFDGDLMLFGLAQYTGSFGAEILTTQYDNLSLDIHVPEPSSIALLGMAILGFAWVAWRKRA